MRCPEGRIRIAIVNDHVVGRKAVKHLLETEPHLEVAAECTDGTDVLRIAREKMNGLDAVLKSSGNRLVVEDIHRVMEGRYIVMDSEVGNVAHAISAASQSTRTPPLHDGEHEPLEPAGSRAYEVAILWHLHGPNEEHCWCEMVDLEPHTRLIRIVTDSHEISAELHQSAVGALESGLEYAQGLIASGWRE